MILSGIHGTTIGGAIPDIITLTTRTIITRFTGIRRGGIPTYITERNINNGVMTW
jgi:hypothetical protein